METEWLDKGVKFFSCVLYTNLDGFLITTPLYTSWFIFRVCVN